MSAATRFRAFFTLGAAGQWQFACALAVLPLVGFALRMRGLQIVERQIARALASTPVCPDSEASLQVSRTARLVAAAARHGPYRANCLPTSLSLQWMLARQGIASQLRVGVVKAGDRLEAHAWVEHQGRPLIDGPGILGRFAAFEPIVPGPGPQAR